MTKVKLHAPVAEMHGEFEKNSGIIMRQKKYRAPNGAVLRVGVQESYKIAHPRDFDKTAEERTQISKLYRKQYSKLDTFIQALLRPKTAINN